MKPSLVVYHVGLISHECSVKLVFLKGSNFLFLNVEWVTTPNFCLLTLVIFSLVLL